MWPCHIPAVHSVSILCIQLGEFATGLACGGLLEGMLPILVAGWMLVAHHAWSMAVAHLRLYFLCGNPAWPLSGSSAVFRYLVGWLQHT